MHVTDICICSKKKKVVWKSILHIVYAYKRSPVAFISNIVHRELTQGKAINQRIVYAL